jgi:putative oxidoreductase
MVNLALLVLRLGLGLTIATHGAQKLFGWFGGAGWAGTVNGQRRARRRPAWFWALMVVAGEFGGGVSVALGLLTPLGAALIVPTMLVAVVISHWPNGFFNSNRGIEFPLLILTGAVAIGLAGPGAISLDAALGLDAIMTPTLFLWVLPITLLGAIAAIVTRATAPVEQQRPQPAST